MIDFLTEARRKKLKESLKQRQWGLRVVLENIHDPHNVSAIFRTCDAVGVPKVSLLYNLENFPKISKITSASASKWIDKEKFTSVDECYQSLRNEGFKIYATMLDENACSIYNIDFTEKSAVILGNEHRGVSKEFALKADKTIYIPMHGMIQSLNVSVAAAVCLYEAQRQRLEKGLYNSSELTDDEFNRILGEWAEK